MLQLPPMQRGGIVTGVDLPSLMFQLPPMQRGGIVISNGICGGLGVFVNTMTVEPFEISS